MGKIAEQVFFRVTMALALICFFCVFFVQRGTAEYFVLIMSGIVNCICVLACLIAALIKGGKN